MNKRYKGAQTLLVPDGVSVAHTKKSSQFVNLEVTCPLLGLTVYIMCQKNKKLSPQP